MAPAAPATQVAGVTILPKRGASVAEMVTMALGLVAFGGLLVLTASRWAPPAARRQEL